MSNDKPLTWQKSLEYSIDQNQESPHRRFAQLATVTKKREPQNRTVVIRGISHEDHSLLFCTDQRSPKVSAFFESNLAQLCWYFTDTREQYRFSGTVQMISDQEARSSMWATLSSETRAQFYWPAPYGSPTQYLQEEPPTGSRLEELIACNTPAPYFLLCKLNVNQVDYLKLRPSPRRLIFRNHDRGWQSEEVNP